MKLRFLAILLILIIFKGVSAPSKPYIINTFFAARHGGGNCELEPDSDVCRQGAADAAYYHALSDAASHVFATLMGVTLGSCSDFVGRRPLIRISAVLHFLVILALASHVEAGWTLWIYLIAEPVVAAFEVSGVFIALVLDVQHILPDKEERKAALAIFGCVILPIGAVCLMLSFSLAHHYAVMVSLIAGGIQVAYVLVGFPETALVAETSVRTPSLLTIARQVRRVLTRNGFIPRLVLVLALLAFAGSGMSVILPPYMTGYVGFTRQDKFRLVVAVFPPIIVLLAFGGVLMRWFGMMRVLQASLAAQFMLPLACFVSTQVWHIVLVFAMLSPPIALGSLALLYIKSNLVAEDEQGLVMGAVSSIGKGAAVIGLVVFGWLFHHTTQDGANKSRFLIAPPFLADAGVVLIAFLFCCSLPRELPPRPQTTTPKGAEPGAQPDCSHSGDVPSTGSP